MENKSQIVRRSFSTPTELHVRETGDKDKPSRTITGYAIMFGVPSAPLWKEENSEAREVIAPGAITKELLDGQDIKMTMFHDRQLLLARSNKGEGTLKYTVDEKGVAFEFDAPNTIDGDKALELVRRGDISGCSFAFSTPYYDEDYVERKSEVDANGFDEITYIVKAVTGIYDFTLAIDPAYEDTSVEAREFVRTLKGVQAEEAPAPVEDKKDEAKMLEQIREMRRIANDSLVR